MNDDQINLELRTIFSAATSLATEKCQNARTESFSRQTTWLTRNLVPMSQIPNFPFKGLIPDIILVHFDFLTCLQSDIKIDIQNYFSNQQILTFFYQLILSW